MSRTHYPPLTSSFRPVASPTGARWLLRMALGLPLVCAAAGAQSLPRPAAPGPDPNAPKLSDYLPAEQGYDGSIPTPESVLGWPVGTWHARHDQMVAYFEALAAASERVVLVPYARSHEQRPLFLAVVTSAANHARLDGIRTAHVEAVRSGAETQDGPAVVWMGYGVHGNEPSASNAALLLGYHLAAATGADFEAYLERTVVIIDPCLNPDGNARFAQWANTHRAKHPTGARANRDHDEAWPGGRTNHYWFDLNRDWLLLTHPESQGRVAQFQRWLPTVLTDYHEMGGDSTYFFQPGIPTRRNPLTPAENHTLTAKIAQYHAQALDGLGRLYFTEERFDDFYYGKGSTYPDIHGAIGILFEQASARGQIWNGDNGVVSFPFAIQNQFTTSLSTLRAADEMRDELSAYQRRFYSEAAAESARHSFRTWVFGCDDEPARALEMARRLLAHGVRVFRAEDRPEGPYGVTTVRYHVAVDQPAFRLLRAVFEARTSWDDNTFYDVSAWRFPDSFGVTCEESSDPATGVEMSLESVPEAPHAVWTHASPGARVDKGAAGWTLPWDSLTAPTVAARLLERGIVVRALTERAEFVDPVARRHAAAESKRGALAFEAPSPTFTAKHGALVVPAAGQTVERETLVRILLESAEGGAAWRSIEGGFTSRGPDLGSGSIPALEAPTVLLAVDGSVSSYEAGEVWHDLDTRVGLAVALVDVERLASIDLDEFTHVVLVNGATRGFGDAETRAVGDFVRGGGVLVATKGSAVWAAENLMSKRETKEEDEESEPDTAPRPYAEYDGARAVGLVSGTIFRARVDTTHPIAYGLEGEISVFRNSTEILPEGNDPFATPLRYTEAPLVAGYASEENVRKIAGSPAVRVERVGSGTVIAMIDNPVFRGVWYGTRPLLVNAILFGGIVERTGPIGR